MKVKELLYEGAKLWSLNCMYSCITKELWKETSSPWNERAESSSFMSLWPFFGCLEGLRSNDFTSKATECDTSVIPPPFWGLGLERLFRNVSLLVRVDLHRHIPVCLLGNPVHLVICHHPFQLSRNSFPQDAVAPLGKHSHQTRSAQGLRDRCQSSLFPQPASCFGA